MVVPRVDHVNKHWLKKQSEKFQSDLDQTIYRPNFHFCLSEKSQPAGALARLEGATACLSTSHSVVGILQHKFPTENQNILHTRESEEDNNRQKKRATCLLVDVMWSQESNFQIIRMVPDFKKKKKKKAKLINVNSKPTCEQKVISWKMKAV